MTTGTDLLTDLKVFCNSIQDELYFLLCRLRPSCDLCAAVCSVQTGNDQVLSIGILLLRLDQSCEENVVHMVPGKFIFHQSSQCRLEHQAGRYLLSEVTIHGD